VLTSHEANSFAVELLVAAELCAFLEAKSVGHVEPPAAEDDGDQADEGQQHR
jgi:hypothetical protein